MSPIKKLSIIIPAYNEENTIAKLLDRVRKVDLINNIEKEIIIINDCSTDNTKKVILDYSEWHPELHLRIEDHKINQGKGKAIHTGISMASGEYLLIQDADLEYDPDDYNKLIKPILQGLADVVYGSRFIGDNPHRILFFWHSIGNQMLTFFSNTMTNLNLTDMETGYKVFRTSVLQKILLKEKRFGFEPEVTSKIAKIPGIRIYEVGVSYYGRTYEEGKKIGWKDAVRTLYSIIKFGLFDTVIANPSITCKKSTAE